MFDAVTETIAHFIGVFSIQLERGRLREEHDRFSDPDAAPDEFGPLLNVNVKAAAPFAMNGFEPGVEYEHAWPNFTSYPLQPALPIQGAPFDGPYVPYVEPMGSPLPPTGAISGLASPDRDFEIEPPGSLAVVIGQRTILDDQDVFLFGDGASVTISSSILPSIARMEELGEAAAPLDTPPPPASETDAAERIEAVAQSLQALRAEVEQNPQPSEAGLHLAFGDETAGTHVDGALQPEAPQFVRPASEDDADEDEDGPVVTTGGNEAINQVVLVDSWTGAPLIAAAGDAIQLDIIMQTNVWCDADTAPAAAGSLLGETSGTNVATFEAIANPAYQIAGTAVATLPQNWAVTRLDTNLVCVNWIDQVNRIDDGDIVSITESGTQVSLQLGGNLQVNFASLTELGLHFDLILVAGNVLDLDMIVQLNVLLDDDGYTFDGPSDDPGNVLWNQASITSVGLTSFAELPTAYGDTIDAVGAGSTDLPPEILGDPALAGAGGLRVLYIEGDFINLTHLRQVNVVDDADLIDVRDGDMQLAGAGNLLLNDAVIYDYGTDTTIYAGGEIYSDALLHQAELIDPTAGDHAVMTTDPAVLASEAVAFLADGMIDEDDDPGIAIVATTAETSSVDVMQGMTA